MKTITIQLHQNEYFYELYNNLIYKQPNSLLYHSPQYHHTITKHLDADAWYVMCFLENRLLGAMPIILKAHSLYGKVANSLPYYGSNGSFILDPSCSILHDKIRKTITKSFLLFIENNEVNASTIVGNPFSQEDTKWLDLNYECDFTDERIGQVTFLPTMSESLDNELLKIFQEPRPRNIRRAVKAGITVSECQDLEALTFLFLTHKENMEEIGGKSKELSFFESIPSFFTKEEYSVYIAYKESKPIAAILLFYFNNTVEYFTPATVHEFRNDQPSALLIYTAMRDAVTRGFKRWNWGGTWLSQSGVYDFKKKWGAQDYPYRYYIRVNQEWKRNNSLPEISKAFPYFYLWPY